MCFFLPEKHEWQLKGEGLEKLRAKTSKNTKFCANLVGIRACAGSSGGKTSLSFYALRFESKLNKLNRENYWIQWCTKIIQENIPDDKIII